MTGKVLGRMLELADIPFLYFFGDNTERQKARALIAFQQDPTKKILVCRTIL